MGNYFQFWIFCVFSLIIRYQVTASNKYSQDGLYGKWME
jgi:hypothetical protein